MDIDGEVAIIGVPGSNDPCDSGSAYIYRYDMYSWLQEEKLLAFNGNNFDEFGTSVAVEDDVAVVGAPKVGSGDYGEVYVYRYNTYLRNCFLVFIKNDVPGAHGSSACNYFNAQHAWCPSCYSQFCSDF